MKKLVLLMLLCALGVIANAQSIRNFTACDVVVTPLCYDPATCAGSSCGAAAVTVVAGAVVALPVCGCPFPSLQGYIVCWSNVGCTALGILISDASGGPCASFPSSNTLNCAACATGVANVFWSTTGDLIIL